MKRLTDEELKQIDEMLKPNPELDAKVKMLMESMYEESEVILRQFNEALEAQFKIVYDDAISNGIIKGKPTKAKFAKAGYDVFTQSGIGTYIRRNGERVSNIIPWPMI